MGTTIPAFAIWNSETQFIDFHAGIRLRHHPRKAIRKSFKIRHSIESAHLPQLLRVILLSTIFIGHPNSLPTPICFTVCMVLPQRKLHNRINIVTKWYRAWFLPCTRARCSCSMYRNPNDFCEMKRPGRHITRNGDHRFVYACNYLSAASFAASTADQYRFWAFSLI